MKKINVAVDGTSGVGKSSTCDRLADANGMTHLDTGAMYRCVALAIRDSGTDLDDEQAVQAILDGISIRFTDGKVLLNGKDVSGAIRTNEISNLTSKVSALPVVRQKMTSLQQETVADKGFIVDGRDICTVVLPDAEVKIFLSARPEARAQRRYDEYMQKGIAADYDQILADIKARDWQDSHRALAPLVKAEDAVEIDTSDLGIDEVVAAMQALVDKAASK